MSAEADRDAAKRPLTVLAGPYGHPFHPIVVTVPIGAWVTSLLFDLASRWADDPVSLATGSRWLLAVGVLGAVVAALFGGLDLLGVPPGTPARRTGYLHLSLTLAVTVVHATSFLLREPDGPVGGWFIAVSALALATLGVAGWLGGKLAYRFGVRVADEATQTAGFARKER